MPLDAITIRALCAELKSAEGARIERVQQPERDVLLLSLRCRDGGRKLLINASPAGARVHFTDESIENPAEPPMFCMLLRKHLTGARITGIEQPGYERMLILSLRARDELGDESDKKLAVELIGRSANLILIGPDGRIVDCIRRSDFGGEGRAMLPGMIYRMPPEQDKTPFFSCSEAELEEKLRSAPCGEDTDKWLLRVFSSLSPLLCRELVSRSGGDREKLLRCARKLRADAESGRFVPTAVFIDGAPRDFSAVPILQYGSAARTEGFESFSAMLDAFYSRRDREERRRRRGRELSRTVKTSLERIERKLALQETELSRTEDREAVRRRAELVTANIYRIKKGDRRLVCEDYFEEDCPSVEIELDPLKSPQQNAAALYREFSKKKAAREHLGVLIGEGRKQADYLSSVMSEIERAETERDLSDIRRELTDAGFIKKKKARKADRTRPQAPLRFVSSDGYEILVGRSNTQNDELTFSIARRSDLWLHTQKLHGSHVVIRCDGLVPPERTVAEAASLAALYSQARSSGRTAVDITQIRFVKKPSGALPGAVIYTDQRTVYAAADEELAASLSAGR